MKLEKIEDLEKMANEVRKGIIEAVYSGQSGHPGGSLSVADILTVLYFNELNMLKKGRDYIFYHSYDYYSSQLSPYLNEWIYANAQKIYFIEKIDRTYVAKVKL